MAYMIRAPSVGIAHELVIRMILIKGKLLDTEDEEATIELPEPVIIHIDTPMAEPRVSLASRFQRKFVDQYSQDLRFGSKAVFEYDYHGRLFDWGEGLTNDRGEPIHVNQIDYIIRKLTAAKNSRRAEAMAWNPFLDTRIDNSPCLQRIQCLIRDGKLNMDLEFRSNDMLTAAGANMYALTDLQADIARALECGLGWYSHKSTSPHIYYKRDIHDLPPFIVNGGYASLMNQMVYDYIVSLGYKI